VDDSSANPKYKVGDFVSCVHLYYNYHYYYGHAHYDQPEVHDFYHGMIVDIDYACWNGYEEEMEIIYIIYCTDGIRRFFSEEEITKLS